MIMASEAMVTIDTLRLEAVRELSHAGISEAQREVRLILAHILGYDQAELIATGNAVVPSDIAQRFSLAVQARLAGYPVFRIFGEKDFMGRSILINEDVLDPRPETELLVERVLEDMPLSSTASVAEIGVGSGAVIISILDERKSMRGTATDISSAAIRTSQENARRHGVDDRLALFEADCLNGIAGRFAAIVSNPPYIRSDAISGLAREVRDHDPRLALDGGPDGLDIYRAILSSCREQTSQGGRLYLETGDGQHADILEVARGNGWELVSAHQDLGGRERILVLQ